MTWLIAARALQGIGVAGVGSLYQITTLDNNLTLHVRSFLWYVIRNEVKCCEIGLILANT